MKIVIIQTTRCCGGTGILSYEVYSMIYDNYPTKYGPYTRKDGRQIIILRKGEGKQITVSYPKYIVECALGRYLDKDETIDHIDGNIYNNDLSNLRIIPRGVHGRSHTKTRIFPSSTCPICGKSYQVIYDRLKTCGSKQCTGKSAHLLGFNKGNNLYNHAKDERVYISNRSEVDTYPTVADLLDKSI